MAEQEKKRSGLFSRKDGKRARKEPLAPYPRTAKLTTMKAKWYDRATEKTRLRATSKESAAKETRKTPTKGERRVPSFMAASSIRTDWSSWIL
jgi:hypothetical protein